MSIPFAPFSFEIGSSNNSSSFLYFPFENFVTNISIFRYTSKFDFAFFGQKAEVHRTVEGKHLFCRSAEVNGKSQNRCVGGWQNHRSTAKEPSKGMLGFQFVYIGVLSDDFADVDLREELCYHSRPKKQFGGLI